MQNVIILANFGERHEDFIPVAVCSNIKEVKKLFKKLCNDEYEFDNDEQLDKSIEICLSNYDDTMNIIRLWDNKDFLKDKDSEVLMSCAMLFCTLNQKMPQY